MSIACTTIFFHTDAEDLIARYEANTEKPCAYLTRVNECWVFVDALATETADWARQLELATVMTEDEVIGLSVFIVGEHWAIGLTYDGRLGPVAAYLPDVATQMRLLPQRLLSIEKALDDLFPDQADPERIDAFFGAVLEGALSIDEAMTEILGLLGCPGDWLRWSWFETVPDQLFIDPDITDRVVPVGETRHFWEE